MASQADSDWPSTSSVTGMVNRLAHRSGAWICLEQDGSVISHGCGTDPCPPSLGLSLIAKSTTPLRRAVVWQRGGTPLRGTVDGVPVTARELGDGATAWFVGSTMIEGLTSEIRDLMAALEGDDSPVHDPFVDLLLHPRGVSVAGRAPAAQLLVMRAADSLDLQRLARACIAATADLTVRVHVDADCVLVAMQPAASAQEVLNRLRRAHPDLRIGVSQVSEGESDWVTGAALARACLDAAEVLSLQVGELGQASVAAEVLLQEGREAIRQLAQQLPSDPLRRLKDHDARGSCELIASLTAWCRRGFDIPTAAEDLGVHRNTLRYRLQRASELTELDLSRPRQRLALQLLLEN